MKTKIISIFALALTAFVFTACNDDDKPSFDFSSDVELKSFAIDGEKGTIDLHKGTVELLLPVGTDLSELTPTLSVAQGATISPAGGTPMDFSVPRVFRVSNGDLYQDYTVTVDVVKAQITRFAIDGREGEINQAERTILVYMGRDADLTALTPALDYTLGATVNPQEGSTLDFTLPVVYVLDYLGSEFRYTVTALALDPPIVLYNGDGVSRHWWDAGQANDLNLSTRNPRPNAVNSTEMCASFTFDKGNDPWTGAGTSDTNINPAYYDRFSAMVLKETPGKLRLEIQGSGGDNLSLEHEYDATKLGQWQEFIFELPADHGYTVIHTILIAPHLEDTADDPSFYSHKMYFDEIKALPKLD